MHVLEDYRRRMLTLWGHAWTVDDGARGNLTHTDTHTLAKRWRPRSYLSPGIYITDGT